MATKNVERVDVFPESTVVKAYPATQYHPGQTGAPAGASAATATVTSGVAAFTGLTASTAYVAYASVGGEDRYLDFTVDPAAAVTPPTGLWEPALSALLAANFNPISASGTFGLTTAGTLYKVRVPVKEPIKASNILLWLATKGATLTAAENFIGLFQEGSRKLLSKATAAETIAKWEGTNASLITIPLESAVNLPAGYVDVGMYYTGTTKPTFGAGTQTAAALINAGQTGAGLLYSSADTGLTTALPATMSSTQTATASPVWVGLT